VCIILFIYKYATLYFGCKSDEERVRRVCAVGSIKQVLVEGDAVRAVTKGRSAGLNGKNGVREGCNGLGNG
jgi:hypothetical protein